MEQSSYTKAGFIAKCLKLAAAHNDHGLTRAIEAEDWDGVFKLLGVHPPSVEVCMLRSVAFGASERGDAEFKDMEALLARLDRIDGLGK